MDVEVTDALQFVKVTVEDGGKQHAGYLTEVSCRLLQIELERAGFVFAQLTIRPT